MGIASCQNFFNRANRVYQLDSYLFVYFINGDPTGSSIPIAADKLTAIA
jgi:hypothetical protein